MVNMNNMSKKIKSLILLLMVILLLLIMVINLNPVSRANRRLKKINVADSMDDELILPSGLYKIMECYQGSLTTEVICKTYNNFAINIVPKYFTKCKMLSDEKIERYFNNHKELIYKELGYSDFKEFQTFIKYLQKLQGNQLRLEKYSIIKASVKSKNNRAVSAYLSIKYADNEEIIFNSTIGRSIDYEKTSIVFSTEYEEKYIIEENTANDYEENQDENLVPKSGRAIDGF